MDYAKLNKRWIYGISTSVFLKNLPAFFVIAMMTTALSYGEIINVWVYLASIPVTLYTGVVSFKIVHMSVLSGHRVPLVDAFEFSPVFKRYFWQYLGIFSVPLVILVIGLAGIIFSKNPGLNIELAASLLIGGVALVYYIVLAFFGTTLAATAVEADGMMLVSRGRTTFWYSFVRLLFLPAFVLFAAVGGGVYFYLDGVGVEEARNLAYSLAYEVENASHVGIATIFAAHMSIMFLNIISAVVLAKAFVLAEVRMAVGGDPSRWAIENFGINHAGDGHIYK